MNDLNETVTRRGVPLDPILAILESLYYKHGTEQRLCMDTLHSILADADVATRLLRFWWLRILVHPFLLHIQPSRVRGGGSSG